MVVGINEEFESPRSQIKKEKEKKRRRNWTLIGKYYEYMCVYIYVFSLFGNKRGNWSLTPKQSRGFVENLLDAKRHAVYAIIDATAKCEVQVSCRFCNWNGRNI